MSCQAYVNVSYHTLHEDVKLWRIVAQLETKCEYALSHACEFLWQILKNMQHL